MLGKQLDNTDRVEFCQYKIRLIFIMSMTVKIFMSANYMLFKCLLFIYLFIKKVDRLILVITCLTKSVLGYIV